MGFTSNVLPAHRADKLLFQIHRQFRKPLLVVAPKNLLRHPEAKSGLWEFDDKADDKGILGVRFKRLIMDASAEDRQALLSTFVCLCLISASFCYAAPATSLKPPRPNLGYTWRCTVSPSPLPSRSSLRCLCQCQISMINPPTTQIADDFFAGMSSCNLFLHVWNQSTTPVFLCPSAICHPHDIVNLNLQLPEWFV